ncbi:hypothetical protein [Methylobacterium oryzihabitans]|uniref:PE-PGRS family protein n=1 Tax=Methylobacterium oryzihabitans TaxID=2499852 RepID=A0A437P9Y6_9HYPH|nr:hypothetical protein [Methylobacterium oryzihabitans]RVU19106.1 hypothetical protein EOE48_09435 [Methylobacterium oryzihabitans]
MSASPLTSMVQPLGRSLEWLVSPDALAGSTALSSGQLSGLGPVATVVEPALGDAGTQEAGTLLPQNLADVANGLVLDTHAQLETTGHEVAALNAPLHGLTHLGETIGLGHLGEAGNLVSDLAAAPAGAGSPGGAAPLLADAGAVVEAAGGLASAVAAAPVAGHGIVGQGGLLDIAAPALNQTVLGLHATLEGAGHQVSPLNGPVHGLTALGESIGLGHVGEPGNLVTDALALPGAVLSGGGLSSATPALGDLGHVLAGADALLDGVTGAATGGLLSPGGALAPVGNLANSAVLNLHAGIESIGHDVPILNDALHGLTHLGETVGLGHLGEAGNLLTDAVALPGEILGGGGLGAVAPVLGDLGAVTGAAGGLVGGVTGIVGGITEGGAGAGGVLAPVTGLLGAGTGGTLLGEGGVLQPVGDLANGVVLDLHAGIESVGHNVPILNDALHGLTHLGETVGLGHLGEAGNLLTDAVALPGEVLAGNGPAAVGAVVADAGAVVDAAGGLVGGATGIVGGLTGGDGQPGGPLAPVTGLLGGGAADHGLIEIGAGPTTPTPIADLAVASPSPAPAQAIQVSAIGVPADQPGLAGAHLLAGDSLSFPEAGTGGADALVGKVLDLLPTAHAADGAEASGGTGLDLGLAGLDLGGHADAQPAETHHADQTGHAGTPVLHLLGL